MKLSHTKVAEGSKIGNLVLKKKIKRPSLIAFMGQVKSFKILVENVCILEDQYTGGPLLTQFFETLEKQPCKQKTV